MRIPPVVLACCLALGTGCAEWRPAPQTSVGLPSSGWLAGGVALPDRGEGFVRGRPGETTRFGTPRLVEAITVAARAVARAYPGSAALRVGDLSAPGGGEHERHASHRTGRDADLVFFLTDLSGRPVEGRAAAFDRHGVARTDAGEFVRFDVARNWELVRTLLLSSDARVQWIFCSHGVKSMLLRYAAEHEHDPDALVRATIVLHQPSRGRPHDDHFHVRVLCGPDDEASGCRDAGPHWTWLRSLDAATAVEALADDATVLGWLAELAHDETDAAQRP